MKKEKKVRIKKEDRAYLYFRENNKGYLNIKFGPEQYSKDTGKFYEVLMVGLLQAVTFLSNVSADLPSEERKNNYDNIANTFQAILFEAFPDIKKIILDEMELEEAVIEAVEEGGKIEIDNEEEFQERIQETKDKLKENFTIIDREKREEELEKYKNDLLESWEFLREIIERIHEKGNLLKNQKDMVIAILNKEENEMFKELNFLGMIEVKEEN